MKTFSASLLTSYATRVSTITSCAKIIRVDGTTYRFTSLDKDLIIDGETYISSYAFSPTAYTSALGLQIENMEIQGAVDSLNIDDFDIFKNLFYGAEVWFFSVDYKNLAAGKDKILYGTVGEIELTDKIFKLEVRGMSKRYENLYASYYGKICRARLGDSRCGVNIADYILSGTVNNANLNSFISTTYIKLDLTVTTGFNVECKIYDILFTDNYDNIITASSVTLSTSDDCKCNNGTGGPLQNILDNSTSTFICLNGDYSGQNKIPYFIFNFGSRKNISKIIIKDEPTWNNNKVETITISTSENGYTWSTIASILDDGYRSSGTISIPISVILENNGTNRYRFTSNDVKAAGKEDNYYQYGNLKWITGANKGLQTEVILADTAGNVELALPSVYDIQLGDTFEMTPGCNHLLVGSDGTTASGHCKTKYNNVLNFRGEAYLPNEDVILSGYIAVQKSREAEEEDEVLLEPIDE